MRLKITTNENMKYYSCDKDTIIDIDIEDYVAGVVASEIGEGPIEALKAQAIAARTFAAARGVLKGKVISDSASVAQAFRGTRTDSSVYPKCAQAAKDTMGLILTYDGKPISAVYCDANGGRTYSSKEVWGSDKPYLIVRADEWNGSQKKNGHGVGMSQKGAISAAKQGVSYKEILSFYYPNTTLVRDKQSILSHIKSIVDEVLAEINT